MLPTTTLNTPAGAGVGGGGGLGLSGFSGLSGLASGGLAGGIVIGSGAAASSSSSAASATARRSARAAALSTYFRRLAKPSQMDFEHAFWMLQQLLVSPKTAYRHTSYHKQTKNQWARDDPAFAVALCVLLAGAAAANCAAFSHSLWHALLGVASAVAVDFLLLGAAVATACWAAANRFLRKRNLPHHQVEQHVEWLYAFDVHCNAWWPLFLYLYVLQLLLSPLLLSHARAAGVLSCLLYSAAVGHYSYLSFLGYTALPFLERTEVFLWPAGAAAAALPLAVVFGFNPSRFVLGVYFG